MELSTLLVCLLVVAVWTLVVRSFPDILTKSVARHLEHRYNEKLEELRGDIQASNAMINTSVDYLTASQAELRSKVISSVEALWQAIESLQDAYSSTLGLLAILTANELDACVSGRERPDLRSVLEIHIDGPQFFVDTTTEIRSKLSGSEIFYVSSRLWILYETIFSVHGRIGYLIDRSLKEKRYHDWRRDKHMNSILRRALSEGQINGATQKTIGGANDIISWLKAEFVKEGGTLVRGPRELAQSVSEIHGILKNEIDDRYRRSR